MSTAFTDLEERVDPKHTVLMVIDVQNDFCHQDGSPGRRGADVPFIQAAVPNMQALIDAAHHCRVPVIYTMATHNCWTNTPVWKERFDPKMAVEGEGFTHCQEGSWGWEFYQVQPTEEDLVIRKPRQSAFYQTHLELTLMVLETKTIVLTGVATGGCVAATAKDASYRVYSTVVVEDGTAQGSRESHQQAIDGLSKYCMITKHDGVIDAWARRGPAPVRWVGNY